jgi:pentatricopeptide repeat protein
VASLKECLRQNDVQRGRALHADLVHKDLLLRRNLYISTALISLYSKCGRLEDAESVMEGLPLRNAAAWNALLAGYAHQSRKPYQALNCLRLMHYEGLDPNRVTFISILSACGCICAVEEGAMLHAVVLSSTGLLEEDVVLGTALVDMYSKCGLLEEAAQVLQNLAVRSIASWNALLSGYVGESRSDAAMRCFQRVHGDGLCPNEITFVCILKACGDAMDMDGGKDVHAVLEKKGLLGNDVVLGTALLNMYVKCGHLVEARHAIEQLPSRNVVSWSSLIAGYVQSGQHHEALSCFEMMESERISPNLITFTCILRACGRTGAVEKGKRIHGEIVNKGLLCRDLMLGNALVEMYAQVGMLDRAEQVLEELPIRNVCSWFALMSGYEQQGSNLEAISCFERMLKERIAPNALTFACILRACGSIGALGQGAEIHGDVVARGLLEEEVLLGASLVDMYAKCGALAESKRVLESLPVCNTLAWNALIGGYVREGRDREASNCFRKMQDQGCCCPPDKVTFIHVLQACGNTRSLEMGRAVHEQIMLEALSLGKDIALDAALIDMYAKCGALAKAEDVLEEAPLRNFVSWNALISGYVREGAYHNASNCFQRMQCEGILPTAVTFICILKICGCEGASDEGMRIHDEILSRGFSLEADTILGTALLDMYAKCGDLARACQVFHKLPERNTISWSALIAGYAQHGRGREALKCFEQMQSEGFPPNIVTVVCILKACASIGAMEMGREIHERFACADSVEERMLGNALVDMYAKCGELARAQQVLQQIPVRDVVSWNALIAGFSQHRRAHEAIDCFRMMQSEGLPPDEITYSCVLNACGHSGLFKEAQVVLQSMTANGGGIAPDLEHLVSMVMAFASSGHFEEAMSVIDLMPPSSSAHFVSIVRVSLLDACRKWGNVILARLLFDHGVKHSSSCSPAEFQSQLKFVNS